MSKKGENIYKRKDGRWEGRYIREYLADGKAKYAYVYGKTYAETKQKLFDSRVAQVRGIESKTAQQSYKTILNDWLAMSRVHTKESTYARYLHLSNTHILPHLGDTTLDRLTTQVVERHISFLLSKGRIDGKGGLAPKTVSDILVIIKGSIDYARCSGYSVNCYLDRLIVKKPQTEMRVLNSEEQKKLLETLLHKTDLPKLGILLSLYTGIRIGEICALKWENINFSEGILSVRETLQRIQNVEIGSCKKTKVVITEPKSRKSIRDIPLPQFVLDMARTLRVSPKAYILTGRTDRYMAMWSAIQLLYAMGETFYAKQQERRAEEQEDIKILRQLMAMPNVRMLLGNHELMMLNALYYPPPEDEEFPEYHYERKRSLWYRNGGEVTHSYLKHIKKSIRQEIFEYLDKLPVNIELTVNGRQFLLTHAAPVDLYENYAYKYDSERDFAVWMRFDSFPVLENWTVIFGHTPTYHFQFDDPMSIWDAESWIGIDCGCMLPETGDRRSGLHGRLACLRLDDMKAFYSEEPNCPALKDMEESTDG